MSEKETKKLPRIHHRPDYSHVTDMPIRDLGIEFFYDLPNVNHRALYDFLDGQQTDTTRIALLKPKAIEDIAIYFRSTMRDSLLWVLGENPNALLMEKFLETAMLCNQEDLILECIDHGAIGRERGQVSLLTAACYLAEDKEKLQKFLNRGYNLNKLHETTAEVQHYHCKSLLIELIQCGRSAKAMRNLIEGGLSVTGGSSAVTSPVIVALRMRQTEKSKLLIEKGALSYGLVEHNRYVSKELLSDLLKANHIDEKEAFNQTHKAASPSYKLG